MGAQLIGPLKPLKNHAYYGTAGFKGGPELGHKVSRSANLSANIFRRAGKIIPGRDFWRRKIDKKILIKIIFAMRGRCVTGVCICVPSLKPPPPSPLIPLIGFLYYGASPSLSLKNKFSRETSFRRDRENLRQLSEKLTAFSIMGNQLGTFKPLNTIVLCDVEGNKGGRKP